MTADDVKKLIIALASLAMTLTPIVALITTWLTKHARLAQALRILSGLVETYVANTYQTRVKDLKDPNKPGEWTPIAAQAAKTNVIVDVKTTAPDVIDRVQSLGIKRIDDLLSSYVEQSVVALNAARLPPPTPENAVPVTIVPNKEKKP